MRDLQYHRPAQRRFGWLLPLMAAALAQCAPTPHPSQPKRARATRAVAARPAPPPRAVEAPSPPAMAARPPVSAGIEIAAAPEPVLPTPHESRRGPGEAAASSHSAATRAPATLLCDLTGTRLPAATCDELREQNGLTRAGIDAAPTSLRMKLHETITYSYSIGAAGNEAEVRANVASGASPIASGRVALGHFNYAKLTGDAGIAIKALDEEVQDTRANPTPTWRWELTANAAGAHRLKLEAGVELRADGTAPVRLGENAKRIDVAVVVAGMARVQQVAGDADTMLGISTSLLKKLGLFFGAAGGALVAYRALRTRPKAQPDA